ncbi:hypothetical protein IWZ03DRAFT_106731 [Phyllosticta citriasiana]|uniref:Uncharacterized protein n=1 Tax=Phyllosticta citriasiana TaxID=595635 RepID=A0ABR1KUX7_9PEZI
MGTRGRKGARSTRATCRTLLASHRAVSAPRPRATTNDDETPLPTSPTNEPPLAANLDSNTLFRANERTTKRTNDRRTKPQNLKLTKRAKLVFFPSTPTTTPPPALCLIAEPRPSVRSPRPFLPPRPRRHPSAVYFSSCAKSVLAVDNRTLGPPSHQRHETDASTT